MDRLEKIRMEVDRLIRELASEEDRKFAYIHLYGTAQFATMLAINAHVNSELCAVAAMLHDIALYAYNAPSTSHAQKSAEISKQLLEKSGLFQEDEIRIITHAVSVHSNKMTKEDGIYAELLKDADVLSHYLYNPKIPIQEQDKVRLYYLLEMLENRQRKAES